MLTIYLLLPIFITIILFSKNNKNKNVKYHNLSSNDCDLISKNTIIISNKYINKNIIDINKEIQFIRWYENININENINIVINSTGGDISSSDAIINILLLHKGKINIYIPRIAYSAGTMIALCADQLYMNNYSLLSLVDPQIDIGEETYSVKSFLNLKRNNGIVNLSEDNQLMFYECKKLYDDNIRNMNKILKNKYSKRVIKRIIKEFGEALYPHEKQFNIIDLKNMEINVKSPVPFYFNSLIKKFF